MDDGASSSAMAVWEEWCRGEFDAGRCPHSGLTVSGCHASICDCFDNDPCRLPDCGCSGDEHAM